VGDPPTEGRTAGNPGPALRRRGRDVGAPNVFDAAAGRRFHGREQAFTVRPERMLVRWGTADTSAAPPAGVPALTGTVIALAYVGRRAQVRVQPEDGPAVVALADLPAQAELLGSTVDVTWPESAVAWLPGG
jgi:putative spermidine/putrescine transport system ATP-binding protein